MPKITQAQIDTATATMTRTLLATLGLKGALKAALGIRRKLLAEKERRNNE